MESAELIAILREVRDRVRERHPQSVEGAPEIALPDLLPVVHARDAAMGKVAAIGTVNPRPGGVANSLVQAWKRFLARVLDWHVREQVEFNRQVVACVDAVIEALNDANRTISRLGSRIAAEEKARRELGQEVLQEIQQLKDIRDHWADWRFEWEHKLQLNEIQFLRSVADLQGAFQHRTTVMDANYRDSLHGQHTEFTAALERNDLDIQKRMWAELEKVRLEYERLIHSELRVIRQRTAAAAGVAPPAAPATLSPPAQAPPAAGPPAGGVVPPAASAALSPRPPAQGPPAASGSSAAASPTTAAGPPRAPGLIPAPPPPSVLPFDYARFADRFRGSEEYVRAGQQFYRPWFANCRHLLDIGCGRGEFLELMRDASVPARGIDLSDESVAACRAKGLEAENADLFQYLAAQPEAAFDGIFCAQVVEHLPPDRLPEMIRLCASRLARNGVIAIETPNPECLAIFATHFYMDPTHTRPVPHPLLAFYLEEFGIGSIEVRKLSPAVESMAPLAGLPEDFRDAFFGALDYAILGRKL